MKAARTLFSSCFSSRMSPDDHVCDIVDSTAIEATETYLMISTVDFKIFGYWFYDSQEREILTLTIEKVMNEVKGIEEGDSLAIPYGIAPTEGSFVVCFEVTIVTVLL